MSSTSPIVTLFPSIYHATLNPKGDAWTVKDDDGLHLYCNGVRIATRTPTNDIYFYPTCIASEFKLDLSVEFLRQCQRRYVAKSDDDLRAAIVQSVIAGGDA